MTKTRTDIAEEIDSFFTHYAHAFETFSARAITGLYVIPCVFTSHDDVKFFNAYTPLLKNMEQLMEAHQKNHFQNVDFEIVNLEVFGVGQEIVNVTVAWNIGVLGEKSLKFSVFYQLCKQAEGWRIQIITNG